MMPPMPSMRSTSFATAMAAREKSTSAAKSSVRPSRLAARSGASGALKHQGEIFGILVRGRPSAASRRAGSLASTAAAVGSKPVTTGLMASTARPCWRRWEMSPQVTNVLPMSVPVAVTKSAVMLSLCQDAGADQFRQALDLTFRMQRAERDAQARRPFRHRWRPDRDHQKTFVFEEARGSERRFRASDDHRHDRALRLWQASQPGEGLGVAHRPRRIAGIALDQVERCYCRRHHGG